MFDRIFISHALEHVADKGAFLAEVWRCLKGEGEVVLVVPHRRSLWARADKTPFGQGTPFSRRQLKLALDQAGFDQISIKHSLYMPPFGRRLPPAMRRRLHQCGPHRLGYVWRCIAGQGKKTTLFSTSATQSCIAAQSQAVYGKTACRGCNAASQG